MRSTRRTVFPTGSSAEPRVDLPIYRCSLCSPHSFASSITHTHAPASLQGSHNNGTTPNPAQPERLHTRRMRYRRTSRSPHNSVPTRRQTPCQLSIPSYSAMAPAPTIVRLDLSVDLSGRIVRTLCVLDCGPIAAHESISRQQMGDASSNRTTTRHMGTKYHRPRKAKMMTISSCSNCLENAGPVQLNPE
jgi:hypothetical protein